MNKIVLFFKESPLSKSQIAMLLFAGLGFAAILIVGAIYLMVTGTKDSFACASFIAVGIIFAAATFFAVNPKRTENFIFRR